MDQIQVPRPKKVTIAVTMLYVTLGVGYLFYFIQLLLTPNTFPRTNMLCSFSLIFFSLSISLLIIYKIGKGRNWARITFLVLLIFDILSAAAQWLQSLPQVSLTLFVSLVTWVIEIIAIVMLFQKSSSDWFILMKGIK